MKIQDCRGTNPEPVSILASNIIIGTVCQGRLDPTGPIRTFLRTFSELVDLSNPHATWTATSRSFSPTLYNYQPVHGRIVIERNA